MKDVNFRCLKIVELEKEIQSMNQKLGLNEDTLVAKTDEMRNEIIKCQDENQ